jgi:hypothetical protein
MLSTRLHLCTHAYVCNKLMIIIIMTHEARCIFLEPGGYNIYYRIAHSKTYFMFTEIMHVEIPQADPTDRAV